MPALIPTGANGAGSAARSSPSIAPWRLFSGRVRLNSSSSSSSRGWARTVPVVMSSTVGCASVASTPPSPSRRLSCTVDAEAARGSTGSAKSSSASAPNSPGEGRRDMAARVVPVANSSMSGFSAASGAGRSCRNISFSVNEPRRPAECWVWAAATPRAVATSTTATSPALARRTRCALRTVGLFEGIVGRSMVCASLGKSFPNGKHRWLTER
jgi:hypothetical protein